MARSWPNIVITGTPACGKSTHCELIVEALPSLRHLNVGDLVKEHGYHNGWDAEYQTYDVDEDAILDHIEPLTGNVAPDALDNDEDENTTTTQQQQQSQLQRQSDDSGNDRGGLLLDWHSCDSYPLRWVDLVVVLQCDHQLLWKRMEKRNYPLIKIQDNNEAEIMQTCLVEAQKSYPLESIVVLRSESNDDMEQNVQRIAQWVKSWRSQHGFSES